MEKEKKVYVLRTNEEEIHEGNVEKTKKNIFMLGSLERISDDDECVKRKQQTQAQQNRSKTFIKL